MQVRKKIEDQGQVEIPGDRISAKDIANAKVFLCSLNQLNNSVTGFRTDLKRLATKRQRKPKVPRIDTFWAEQEKIQDNTGNGAPSTNVIIQGSVQVNAVLDCGSAGCLMSLGMAKAVGISELFESPLFHGMADGSKVAPVGYAKDVSIMMQGVTIVTDVAVFDQNDYDFLIGRKALHRFGLYTDWSSYHWFIKKTDGSIVPVPVIYTNEKKREIIKLDPESDISTDEESYDEETTSEYSTSYVVLDTQESSIKIKDKYHQPQDQQKPPSRSEEMWQAIVKGVDNSNLSKENYQRLLNILYKYQDVFGLDYQDLTQTTLVQCHVDTGDARPIMHQPNRYMSHSELEQLKGEIDEMVKQGQLIPSSKAPGAGGWSFPALYVRKNDNTKRLCVQFQRLNEVTKKQAWPTNSITDLIE
ncbi:hypothetical protein BDC45DRAFT_452497, partial [Circinella umbellata]